MLPRSAAVRGVGLIAGGTAAGHALALLLSPVLTRIYAPADFGLSGVFISVMAITSVVGTLRYEFALPVTPDERSAMNMLVAGLLTNLAVVTLVALSIPVLGDPLATLIGSPALADYMWLLPPTLIAVGSYRLMTQWSVRTRQYTVIARRNLYFGTSQVIIQVGLGLLGLRPIGLLLSVGVGHTVGALTIGASLLTKYREVLRQVSVAEMRRVLRRYIRFPLLSSWAGILNTAGSFVPLLVIAKLFGPTVAGWYVLTTRVVGSPMDLISEAVAPVYLGEAASLTRQEPRALRRLFMASFRRLLLAGIVPVAAIAAPAPLWFPVVFGDQWREAGLYALLLIPFYLAHFVATPLSTLILFEKQHLDLAWDAARFVLGVGSIVTAWRLGASPLQAIGTFGAVMAGLYVVLLVLNYQVTMRAASRPRHVSADSAAAAGSSRIAE
jgi:O-antigen/teichoic acid export membrane protein